MPSTASIASFDVRTNEAPPRELFPSGLYVSYAKSGIIPMVIGDFGLIKE
jgi:hypothetical protein